MGWRTEDNFKDLIGKQILYVAHDDETLRFHTAEGDFVFSAEGDCCSKSYIESIDDISVFHGAKLLEIEDVKGDTKEDGDWKVLKWRFYKFKTSKGRATLSFRNESNGYYDGHLELVCNPVKTKGDE